MAEIKLFRLNSTVEELRPSEVTLERNLQTCIEQNTVVLEEGFTRDMRGVGHYGTGDLQVVIQKTADLEKAKSLLVRAYTEN